MPGIDPAVFRAVAGHFPTGVTVVTTLGVGHEPVGLTVNSFSTVSLDPPLVLFCLGNGSETNPAFAAGHGYVVNVLAAHQVDLSRRFAAPVEDRFEGVAWEAGYNGMPVLTGALAVFECELDAVHDAGDHRILVGRVARLRETGHGSALGYFRSNYVAVDSPDGDRV